MADADGAAGTPASSAGAFASATNLLHRARPALDDHDPNKPRDVDPANPARSVPTKKANQPYLVHQRYLQEQAARKRAQAGQGTEGDAVDDEVGGAASVCCERFVKAMFYSLLVAAALGLFITGSPIWGYKGRWVRLRTYFPPPQRVFTPHELQLYSGRAPDRPIYLAVMGDVYDVSSNPRIYGPGGSYGFFAGRDASRAYITGCFDSEEQLTHDLRGLSDEDMSHVLLWKKFFDQHDTYFKVGRVSLPPLDPNSPPPGPCEPSKT